VTKLKPRFVLDIALTVMLVFEMLISLTGVIAHEIVGFLMFACLIAHLALSRGFFRSIGKVRSAGKHLRAKQRAQLIVAIALFTDLLALFVSSLAISTLLSQADLDLSFLNPGNVMLQVHSVTAYLLCALAVVHLALHWNLVASTAKIPYDPARRKSIEIGVGAVAGVAALALSVQGVSGVLGASTGSSNTEQTATSDTESSSMQLGGSSSTNTNSHGSDTGSFWAGTNSSSSNANGSSSSTVPGSSSSGTGGSSNSGSTTTQATCPLCHRNCPLSDPQCSRPEEAGLI
jgi:hypothetical protein